MSDSDIKKGLRTFILTNYLFTDDESALGDDDSFLDNGVLDSMGVLELIDYLTEDLNVEVDGDEVTPDNLDSINKVVQFVTDKTKS